jgi:outer membrane protein
MNHRIRRAASGVALIALVVAGTTPAIVRAKQPAASQTPSPLGTVGPAPTIQPNATITLAPASQPTSLPYPAYGTPVPGVNGGIVVAGVPQVITLDQAVAIAYAKSPSLASARASIQQAVGSKDETQAGLLPTLEGSGSSTRTHDSNGQSTTSGAYGPFNSTSNSLSVSLRQLIFDGGRTVAELRAAKFTLGAAYDTYRRAMQTVAYNVAVAYYNDLAAQRATAIAVATVNVDLVNESLVAAQIRAGTEAKADLATAQLSTAQERVTVVRDQSTELQSEATFANAMGLDANTFVLPRDDTPVNGSAVPSTIPVPSYDVAFKRAVLLRPDVDAVEQEVASARESLRAAKLGLFPSLSGTASEATASQNASGGAFANTGQLGVALTVPIYDGGLTAGATKAAQGALQLAFASQQTTVQGVQLNVKQTLTALVSARQAIDETRVELAEAQIVLASTQAQFKAGVTTLPLLLNAQVGLTQALTDQSTAVYTLRQAEQAFLYAEGANGNS